MKQHLLSLGLAGFALVLTGCAYDNAACTSGSCSYVKTTTYVPTTTYVAKTTYVPTKAYVVTPTTYTSQTPCCSTCGQCGYDSGYDSVYGSYNLGWY